MKGKAKNTTTVIWSCTLQLLKTPNADSLTHLYLKKEYHGLIILKAERLFLNMDVDMAVECHMLCSFPRHAGSFLKDILDSLEHRCLVHCCKINLEGKVGVTPTGTHG